MKKLVLIFSLLLCMVVGSMTAATQKLVAEKDAKNALWGYKAQGTDKWVVKPKYSNAMPFVTVNGSEVAFAKDGDFWEEVDAKGKVLQKFYDVKPYTDSSKFIFVQKYFGEYGWGYIGTGSRPSSETFNYTKEFKNISPDNFIAYAKEGQTYFTRQAKLITLSKDGKYNELPVKECGNGYLVKGNDGQNQIFNDKGVYVVQIEGEKVGVLSNHTTEKGDYRFLTVGGQYGPKTLYYINPGNEMIKLINDYLYAPYVENVGDYYVVYLDSPKRDTEISPAPFVIDRNGKKILTADAHNRVISSNDGKLFTVKKVDGFGRILTDGIALYSKDGRKLFDDGSYVSIFTGPEGTYYSVTTNGKVGVINGDLEWIVPQGKYTKFEVEKNGYRFFTADNKEVMTDKHFKMDDAATAANSNTARVTYKNGKWAFTKNGVAVTAWYDDYNGATSASYSGYVTNVFGRNPNSGDEIIMVAKNGKFGLLNTKTLKEVAPCVYDKIGARAYGRIRVKKAGLCGFLDGSTFQVVVPCKYISVDNYMERAQMSQNPFALVVMASEGGRYKIGYINKSGQVFETQYAPKTKVVIW